MSTATNSDEGITSKGRSDVAKLALKFVLTIGIVNLMLTSVMATAKRSAGFGLFYTVFGVAWFS